MSDQRPEWTKKLSTRLDRMADIEHRWDMYFHDSLMEYIRRGESPDRAVELATQTAALAATVITDRVDAAAAATNALIERTAAGEPL